MKTRILDRHHIARIVDDVGLDALMDQMIERVEAAILDFDPTRTLVRPRDGFHYDEPNIGLLEWMPVMQTAELTTIKVVGYHPSNPEERDLPTILSTVSAYETATGHLAGLVDGTFLTALRTGAASAVASRRLARNGSRVVGLVGCGAQAVTQLHALTRTFPLEVVLIHDIDVSHMASFPGRVAGFLPEGIEIRPASLDLLIQTADVVCTTTSIGIGEGPLFDGLETRPWLHVNAVGSDFPGKVELPYSFLTKSLVCPDHREQAIKEGECQQLEPDTIGPSLAELVQDEGRYEGHRDRTTVFDSTGWALEDRVGVQLLFHHADRLGLGLMVELEDIGEDPMNPYGLPLPGEAGRISLPTTAQGG